jgi:4'-phosphopantetheinyl transferase EntD
MLSLLPVGTVLVEAGPEAWVAPLTPEDERAMEKAVARRRREFAAGRWCAGTALEQLRVTDPHVGRGPHGSPMWPAGIVGSITHCAGYCAAAVAHSDVVDALGIDAEVIQTIDAIARRVCSPEEMAALPRLPGIDASLVAFSAKEATFKAWYPLTARMLSYHDISVSLDARMRTFTARLVDPGAAGDSNVLDALHGRFSWARGHVFTVAWVNADPARTAGDR